MGALEFIKSKYNGEIPYKYGSAECAKLMTEYARYYLENNMGENYANDMMEAYAKGFQSAVDCVSAANESVKRELNK